MASSLTACLHSVGFEIPRVHDVVPLLDVDGVVEALVSLKRDRYKHTLYLQDHAPSSTHATYVKSKTGCPRSPPSDD